jgi:hypothetical protein
MVNDGKIQVRITDQAGGKDRMARLPGTALMSDLLKALVTRLELPSNQEYEIQHKESGKILTPTDTLLSAGVKDGDTLRLLPRVIAG